ncbi:hypothetical protein C1645_828772 [Glomus cerebriforme]|uniref:Uncharacterized protein n=1 Tax=Glomus cerebriforme TaxID=658196 RepID=A0A397SKV9_9GLOM|nr:hypothetical protein C1645_828772 [Glomus cerebriforme]
MHNKNISGPGDKPTAMYLHEKFSQWWIDIVNNKKDSEIYKQIVEANKINKKQASFTKSDNTKLIYTTHQQAIFTSRLLNFNKLPKPKNADSVEEYSKSIEPIDFTKLNINP